MDRGDRNARRYGHRRSSAMGVSWGGEYMPNLHLQINPVFIPIASRVIIWDFRLRPPARRGHRGLRPGGISDLWYRFALSFLLKSIELLKYSTWLWHKSCTNMM